MTSRQMLLPVYSSRYFALYGVKKPRNVLELVMLVPKAYRYTTTIPDLYDLVAKTMPSVLETTCFNDEELPFEAEMRATELPHFFEHALLDIFCTLKAERTNTEVCLVGWTSWDWSKDPEGMFRITLRYKRADLPMLLQSVQLTIAYLEMLLGSAAAGDAAAADQSNLQFPPAKATNYSLRELSVWDPPWRFLRARASPPLRPARA